MKPITDNPLICLCRVIKTPIQLATVYSLFACLQVTCVIAAPVTQTTHASPPGHTQNEIVFAVGSPQWSSLKIEPVTEIPAPATEPMNGKIILNENKTARVFSPVAGRVLRIEVMPGDTVKTGQTLLNMDSPDLGNAVSDSRKADADLQLKQQTLERSKLLYSGGVIAQKEVELAQADWLAAKAEAERAQARLRNLGANRRSMDGYQLRSPLAGVVVERHVNPGSEVRPDASEPQFVITDPSAVWASIDVPERALSKVHIGQAVSVQVDAYPETVFPGNIRSIGIMVDPQSRRVPVLCDVQSRGQLKPEMYARVTPLDAALRQVIRLPNSALISEGLYSAVFVEVRPGHLQKRRVILDAQQREYATVKSGLRVGERVVTAGALLLNAELSAPR